MYLLYNYLFTIFLVSITIIILFSSAYYTVYMMHGIVVFSHTHCIYIIYIYILLSVSISQLVWS